jgi:hypothetical protein
MALRTFIRSLAAAADGVEHATEWALDQVFAGGKADVFDFTRELIRVLDFHAQPGPAGSRIAPNRYTLSLRADLYGEYAPLARQYEKELADRLKSEIDARKYQTQGKIEVRMVKGEATQGDEILVVCVVSVDTVIANPPLQLVGQGKSYPLQAETTTLGRHPANDIPIAHEKVSRYHAEIRSTLAGYVLVDLGSANGTSRNGQPLPPQVPVAIHEGDRIRIAAVEFIVKGEHL